MAISIVQLQNAPCWVVLSEKQKIASLVAASLDILPDKPQCLALGKDRASKAMARRT